MNFGQLVHNNVTRNKRLYLGHFLSSTFAVMILFTFELLAFHPNFTGNLVSTSETMSSLSTKGFKIAQYLIIFFSFFFILYSITMFLKTRKKEFGILLLHGMSNAQLKKLIFMENMLIGCSAIIVGIGLGLVFGKLILLISGSLFLLKGGLPFHFPTKAILVTSLMFFILFILVSFFTVRIMKVSQLIELMKSEEKPKAEPKSSKWLAFFSILCICIGYASAFYLDIALKKGIEIYVLLLCVFLTVLGTYFLFTQLSFYVIKILKNRQYTFFKKTNMLMISELTYRMTDNARTIFLVSVLSAVAFTSIGACLSIGNGALAEVNSPYAFEYKSYKHNKGEAFHISQIEEQLHNDGFSYKLVTSTGFNTTRHATLIMKLTDYNATAKTLGYPAETLNKETDSLILPSKIYLRAASQEELKKMSSSLTLEHGNMNYNFSGNKILMNNIISPSNNFSVVVSDSMYETILNTPLEEAKVDQYIDYRFLIKNMYETADVAKKLTEIIPNDYRNGRPPFIFDSPVLKWLEGKQVNAILSILSVLVGVVFFVFTISFLYFRLFTDLDRDKNQFQMLSKLGLTKREIKKIVTQQISILFFIPIVISVLHSSVAFFAIRFLAQSRHIDLPIAGNSILIFTSFISVQIIYYLIIRRSYLRQILHSIK
ncbi:ABC transporter permease [Bacillus thuringiensis serovar brasilensis]|uniref:ABC transporter permease n=1 Tax=Bacillus cereus group TaxID=86661 RepID=UPI000A389329|nr:ABC transporter permease [Bacillus thuringiensis]MCU5028378.1 ABC transporter permease [Bacillus cereus]MRA72118.1 FtsX-like permease family protein [Bacillus thuringiensis]MRA90998.1 FtsX-like permease family protein [Bacillus thuringiensis]MRC53216.1 FtsX-like permease family protein [Bacillus thuringiensis]OTX29863.1 ABC transporter permease [Bacillus thuringiensis serovar brasilensis]